MYGVMYLEGDCISTLKYSMLYLDSDMLFRIRYYIRMHILYLVRTDVPHCLITIYIHDMIFQSLSHIYKKNHLNSHADVSNMHKIKELVDYHVYNARCIFKRRRLWLVPFKASR